MRKEFLEGFVRKDWAYKFEEHKTIDGQMAVAPALTISDSEENKRVRVRITIEEI